MMTLAHGNRMYTLPITITHPIVHLNLVAVRFLAQAVSNNDISQSCPRGPRIKHLCVIQALVPEDF